MYQPVPVICLSLLVSATAPPAASAWLSDTELEQSCDAFLADPRSDEGTQCLAFVQGYLTAADPGRAGARERDDDESFAQRAARTRLGTLRMQRLEGVGPPAYCVDEDVPAIEVVQEIVAYLREDPETCDLTDTKAVSEALAQNFPCGDQEHAGN